MGGLPRFPLYEYQKDPARWLRKPSIWREEYVGEKVTDDRLGGEFDVVVCTRNNCKLRVAISIKTTISGTLLDPIHRKRSFIIGKV